MVMEVFGRYAGHTAFRAGIAAEADAILIPEIPTDFDVLYAHCKERYFHRIAASDVKAGTYLILVAEGLKDASGKELVDESAGLDSFGHKRLAGAGKYVCDQLTNRFKNDPGIPKLMQREKMYVKKALTRSRRSALSPRAIWCAAGILRSMTSILGKRPAPPP